MQPPVANSMNLVANSIHGGSVVLITKYRTVMMI